MRHLTYLDFLRDSEIQTSLQLVVNTPSLFMRDLERTSIRARPLFMKLLFREEGMSWNYTKNLKINKKEESIPDYQARLAIALWIQKTWKFIFSAAAVPAKIWKTTIPKWVNPLTNILMFPQGDFYSMISFGKIKDIIEHEKGKSQDEIFLDLDELKKRGEIAKGRFDANRIKTLDSGDVVFFVTQNYISIPCLSRESFIYLRQQIYANIPNSDYQ